MGWRCKRCGRMFHGGMGFTKHLNAIHFIPYGKGMMLNNGIREATEYEKSIDARTNEIIGEFQRGWLYGK